MYNGETRLMALFHQVHFSNLEGYTPVCVQRAFKFLVVEADIHLAIGIIGATVMPHSIFLGSALATQDRVNAKPEETSRPLSRTSSTSSDSGSLPDLKAPRPERLSVVRRVRDFVRGLFWVTSERHVPNEPKSHAERENNSLGFVRAHIYHGMVDIVVSLFGLAVIINAL